VVGFPLPQRAEASNGQVGTGREEGEPDGGLVGLAEVAVAPVERTLVLYCVAL
jgi:hypothetical protein